MADKPIARLVGEVGFVIDNKALDGFFRRLQQTESQMRQVGKLADTLASKLSKVGGGSAGRLNTKQLASDVARLEILLARVAGAKSKAQTQFNKEALSAGRLVFAGKNNEFKLQKDQFSLEKQRLGIEQLRQRGATQSAADEIRLQQARRRLVESTAINEQRQRNLGLTAQQKILRVQREATALQKADFGLRLQKEREARREAYSGLSRSTPNVGIGRGAGFSLGPIGGLGALTLGLGLATSVLGGWTAALQASMAALQGQQYAVNAAAGGGASGEQANQWLTNYTESRGMDRAAISDQYASFLASGQGAGLNNGTTQGIFSGFGDLFTSLHLNSERQKGSLYAISQMLGKGGVRAEELNTQLADHLPGAKSIFAQAYAETSKSGLTGQKALEALDPAMKAGLVKLDTILRAAEIARQRAAPTVEASSKTAQAESNRATNAKNATILAFAQAGGDAANAKVFIQMRELWKDLQDRTPQLARIYGNLASAVESVVLRMRALIDVADRLGVIDGVEEFTSLLRDANVLATNLGLVFAGFAKNGDDANGLLGKWLSPEEAEQFRKDVADITTAWNDLQKAFSGLDTGVFGTVSEFLAATAREVAGITSAIRKLIDTLKGERISREDREFEDYKAGRTSLNAISPYNKARADDLKYGRPIRTREQVAMDDTLKTTIGLLPLAGGPPVSDNAKKALDATMANIEAYGKAPVVTPGSATTNNTSNVVNIGSGAIVVNAAEGQSPQDIANIVQDELTKSYAGLKAGQQITK